MLDRFLPRGRERLACAAKTLGEKTADLGGPPDYTGDQFSGVAGFSRTAMLCRLEQRMSVD